MIKTAQDLRIVFFGTPEFAVASLAALVAAGCNVAGIVTAPDKPAGRGLQLHETPVKVFAVTNNIPVLQPPKLKNPAFLETLKALNADLHIVVAFRMLPEAVWNMPPMGTINVHGSLLPKYRGAAPINWAIINGETVTGVTTFKLKHDIDTGDILLQQEVPITDTDNAGTMHDKLMVAGAELLIKTIEGLAAESIDEISQKTFADGELKHAPKIFKEKLQIDWSQPAASVYNFIRGMAPHPTAFTLLQGKSLKIYESSVEAEANLPAPGTFETDGKIYLRFAANDGWIYAKEVQQEGKKRMLTDAFLRGFRS